MEAERLKRAEKYWKKGRLLEDCLFDALELAEKGIAKFDFEIVLAMQHAIDDQAARIKELCIELGNADIEVKRLGNQLSAKRSLHSGETG